MNNNYIKQSLMSSLKPITSDFNNYEKKGIEKLKAIAKKYPKVFSEIKQTEPFTKFDALVQNETGGTFAVEIKTRNAKEKDAFIELGKFEYLRDLWRFNGILTLYIVFYPDETYLWVLPDLTKDDVVFYDDVVVNQRDGYKYETDRFGLNFNAATHFNSDGRIIYSPHRDGEKKTPKFFKHSIMEGTIDNKTFKKPKQ